MSSPRMTKLLAVLVIAAALVGAVAWLRFADLRADAHRSREQLLTVRQDIEQMKRWRSSPGRATAVPPDIPEINRRLRDAAAAAGMPDAPGSDPSPPQRIPGSDYSETVVYLDLRVTGLRELLTFVHHLTRNDPACRVKQIELGPPIDPAPGEVWQTGVGVAWLTYTPQRAQPASQE